MVREERFLLHLASLTRFYRVSRRVMKYLPTICLTKAVTCSHVKVAPHNSALSSAFTPSPLSWQRFTPDQNNLAISYLRLQGFIFQLFLRFSFVGAFDCLSEFPHPLRELKHEGGWPIHWKMPRSAETWSCPSLEGVGLLTVRDVIFQLPVA